MKKILALMLVFVTVFTFAACGGGNDDPSTPSTPSTPSNPDDVTLEGKTLQVWAMVGPEYESVEKIQAGVWLWMVRAAMEEWAAINKVNLQFVSNYDQMSMMAAISSGSKPDFMFSIGGFPEVANLGVVQELTAAQQEKINAVIGPNWYLTYRGKNVGVLPPWAGSNLVYYNESMMERYGVTKTPMEYIEDGEWTWENFLKLCEECTKDLNFDGINDTYGSTTYSVNAGYCKPYYVDKETGRIISQMDSDLVAEWLDIYYDAVVVKKTIINSYIDVNDPGSGVAMTISDCEPYNFQHLYKTLSNGDVIRAVRTPTRYAGDTPNYSTTLYQFAIPRGADEADAAVDMLTYILKAGLVWVADHSEGIYETEYEGIVGACEYSAAWKEQYDAFIESRHEEFEVIEDVFGIGFYRDLYSEYLAAAANRDSGNYLGVQGPWQGHAPYGCIFTDPPATSLPQLIASFNAKVKEYNDKYIF